MGTHRSVTCGYLSGTTGVRLAWHGVTCKAQGRVHVLSPVSYSPIPFIMVRGSSLLIRSRPFLRPIWFIEPACKRSERDCMLRRRRLDLHSERAMRRDRHHAVGPILQSRDRQPHRFIHRVSASTSAACSMPSLSVNETRQHIVAINDSTNAISPFLRYRFGHCPIAEPGGIGTLMVVRSRNPRAPSRVAGSHPELRRIGRKRRSLSGSRAPVHSCRRGWRDRLPSRQSYGPRLRQ